MIVFFAVVLGVNWLPLFFLATACFFTGIFFFIAFVLPTKKVQKTIEKIWQRVEERYRQKRRRKMRKMVGKKRIERLEIAYNLENAPTLREE